MISSSFAVVVGLVVGWLRRGNLVALGETRIRWAWLIPIPLGLAVEAYIGYAVGREVPPWILPLHLAAYGAVLWMAIANRRLSGVPIAIVGLVLNALVVGVNGGLMPESPQTIHVKHPGETFATGEHPRHTKNVVLPRDRTTFWWLSDVIVTPAGLPIRTVFSPGDLALAIGLAWIIQGLMQPQSGARSQRPLYGNPEYAQA